MFPLVSAAECVTRSGPATAALVELYTSEGCSSCPPADRWLSQLKPAAEKGTVVPVAFHVTYWDYIGWRDAFADERHTARQRARAGASGARYVYTPQVVLGGRDFRGWSSGSAVASVTFSARGDWKPDAMTLAAFVQDVKTGDVLQALAAPLGGC